MAVKHWSKSMCSFLNLFLRTKSSFSSACEKIFAGEAITETETKEAALAWVPDAMRFDIERPTIDGLSDDDDEADDTGETSADDTDLDPDADSNEDPDDDPADDFGDDINDFDVEHPDEALEPAE